MRAKWIVSVAVLALLCLAWTGVAQAGPERVDYTGHKLVRVQVDTLADWELLNQISPDIWTEGRQLGEIDARIPPDRMADLDASGLTYEVTIEDIEPLASAHLSQPAGAGTWDQYMSYAEIVAFIQNLEATRPDLCEIFSIGQSIEGRELWVLHITGPTGENKPAVFYEGLIHAREWISGPVVLYLADYLVNSYDIDLQAKALVDGLDIYILPAVNPDGYEYARNTQRLWRKNRRNNGGGSYGVDLNRNWDAGWGGPGSSGDPDDLTYRGTAPFSEPETAAIRDFIQSRCDIVSFIDYHSYGQYILYPFGYKCVGGPPEPDRTIFQTLSSEMQGLIQSVHGRTYTYGPTCEHLYTASGGSNDWVYEASGAFAFVIELRDTGQYGFVLPPDQILPTVQENLPAVLHLMDWSLDQVQTRVTLPDGVPTLLAPEEFTPVALEVCAVGESIVPGSAQLLYRYDGGAYISVPMTDMGDGRYEADLPPALCEDTPEFYFSIEGDETGVQTMPAGAPGDVFTAGVGVLDELFADNFNSDTGWTVENSAGLADGAWTRGIPVGGGDRGDPPADYDGSGYCYLTDNVDGNSDVDDGYTWLISPILDLTDTDAQISYALWYTNNNGGGPNADIFVTYVSNNGGSTWVEVETIGPESPPNAWIEHSFLVSDFVTPTAQVRVRFEASDLNEGSVVEAGIDAFLVSELDCESGDPIPQACCYEDGTCADQLTSECLANSGTPQGADTSCATVECPQPDLRKVQIDLQSSVEPDDLCPGEAFSVDIYLSSLNGDIDDVRLLQFDTSLTSAATVDGFTWDMEALTDMSLYLLDDEPDVVRAVYATGVGLPGFIVNLNSTPQKIGVVDLTFGGGSGELNLLGPGGPPGDFSVRFQADFVELNEYTATNGKVEGGVLALSEGPCDEIMITSSYPPNGAIDARRPHEPADVGIRYGWNELVIEFDGDVAALTPADFAVSENGGDGTPPNVLSVNAVGPTTIELTFDDMIEPLAWTTLTHVASGTSVMLGYLPADANQDAFSSSFDTLSLIDHLNSVVLLPEPYATDIDRSGLTDSFDILEVINLLNGAEMYDVYNEASLP
jgi:carboxypeptidase A4